VSFEDAPTNGGTGGSDPGLETGDVAEPAEQVDDGGQEPPPRQYVEVDDPDQRYVRVRVDNQDVEVPFSEAIKGYSRTEDYTRKTQEVARLREEADFGLRLNQALQANPEMTLQVLAQQYGLNVAPPAYYEQPQQAEEEYSDPLEAALAQERNARMALEQRILQRESDQALEVAIGNLRGQYNATDDDLRTVVSTAYQMGVGLEALPMVYEAMAFQRLTAQVQAMRAQRAQQEAEAARRTAAKTQAGQIVSSGSGINGAGITNQVDPNGHMTIREAALAALEQHGL
jgi:hypothetical protein